MERIAKPAATVAFDPRENAVDLLNTEVGSASF